MNWSIMFESQGTTPEPEYKGTIDKAKDFLARKVAEQESSFTSEERLDAENVELELTITKLQASITVLEQSLEVVELKRDHFKRLYNESQDQLNSACQSIQDVLAGDVDAQQTFEDFKDAFELLGVSLEREVEIEVMVAWRGTITIPMNVDVSDLDINDFGIDQPYHSEYQTTGFDYGYHDYGISEV